MWHEFIKISLSHLKKVSSYRDKGQGWQAQSPGKSFWKLKVVHTFPIHEEEAVSIEVAGD